MGRLFFYAKCKKAVKGAFLIAYFLMKNFYDAPFIAPHK
jgi:hypothetical protein